LKNANCNRLHENVIKQYQSTLNWSLILLQTDISTLGLVVRHWYLRYGEISGRNGKKLWILLSFQKTPYFHSVSFLCLTLKSLLINVEKWQIIKNMVKISLYVKYHAIFGITTTKYYKMTSDTIRHYSIGIPDYYWF